MLKKPISELRASDTKDHLPEQKRESVGTVFTYARVQKNPSKQDLEKNLHDAFCQHRKYPIPINKLKLAHAYYLLEKYNEAKIYFIEAVNLLEQSLKIHRYSADPTRFRLWVDYVIDEVLDFAFSLAFALHHQITTFFHALPKAPPWDICEHDGNTRSECETCGKATVELARCYLYGVGTGLHQQAFKNHGIWLLEGAAAKKHISASTELSVCYRDGVGVERSSKKVMKLLQLLIKPDRLEDADPRALYLYGICLRYGIGVEPDEKEAQALIINAMDKGYRPRCLYSCDDPKQAVKMAEHRNATEQQLAQRMAAIYDQSREAQGQRKKPANISTRTADKAKPKQSKLKKLLSAMGGVLFSPLKIVRGVCAGGWQMFCGTCARRRAKQDSEVAYAQLLAEEIQSSTVSPNQPDTSATKKQPTTKTPKKSKLGESKKSEISGKNSKANGNETVLSATGSMHQADEAKGLGLTSQEQDDNFQPVVSRKRRTRLPTVTASSESLSAESSTTGMLTQMNTATPVGETSGSSATSVIVKTESKAEGDALDSGKVSWKTFKPRFGASEFLPTSAAQESTSAPALTQAISQPLVPVVSAPSQNSAPTHVPLRVICFVPGTNQSFLGVVQLPIQSNYLLNHQQNLQTPSLNL